MITATANTAMAEAVLRNGAAYTEGFGIGAKDGLDILLSARCHRPNPWKAL